MDFFIFFINWFIFNPDLFFKVLDLFKLFFLLPSSSFSLICQCLINDHNMWDCIWTVFISLCTWIFVHSVLVQEQSSFSWDWGPSFPTMGLWKEVRLEAFDVLHLIQVSSVPLYSAYQILLIIKHTQKSIN